ncbi:MAG TPA: LysR family transcriptional regulator [Kofleriaceae bacterium]|jgi:DNA-binding transcriptional LysR family regulator|nr:LysR family transcriptional regulator [Kofleriaceae bacterium]
MDLNRAATFLQVVESGGFTAAATALGLPTSSVSRSVAKLEEDLGVVLLERTTRRVALTEVGRAYFERVREALAGLDEATAAALDSAREPQGMVRIAVPPDFSPALAPVVAAFLRSYPKIRIEVSASARAAELVGEHVDLGLVHGKLPDSALISRRVAETSHRLFAAPGYLAARGTPRTLDDLAHHDAILSRSGPAVWELTGPNGPESVQVAGAVAGDHLGFIIDTTVAGLGIALLPAFAATLHLRAGTLVEVLPAYGASIHLQLLTQASRRLPYRVALLRDFLVTHLSSACSGAHGACGAVANKGAALKASLAATDAPAAAVAPAAPVLAVVR